MSGHDTTARRAGMEPALVTTDVAAAALSITPRALDTLRKRGHINAKMNGNTAMYLPAEVRRYAEDLPDWEPK